jgi:hypothetical protein
MMSSGALSSNINSLSDADDNDKEKEQDVEEEVIQESTTRYGGKSQEFYIASGTTRRSCSYCVLV